jgi:hypothetical protein
LRWTVAACIDLFYSVAVAVVVAVEQKGLGADLFSACYRGNEKPLGAPRLFINYRTEIH